MHLDYRSPEGGKQGQSVPPISSEVDNGASQGRFGESHGSAAGVPTRAGSVGFTAAEPLGVPSAGVPPYFTLSTKEVRNSKSSESGIRGSGQESIGDSWEREQGQLVGYRCRVKCSGCRSRFCKECGPRLGHGLRKDLFAVLAGSPGSPGFAAMFGITLTLDPELFDGPADAHRYVMQRRCLSRFVAWLHAQGVLHSRRYFWVMEFQENGMPHWHLVVETKRIEFGTLVVGWSKFRPKTAGRPTWKPGKEQKRITEKNYKQLVRPAFGHVRFTPHTSDMSARAACWYLSKYFTKHPAAGWPSWVLNSSDVVLCKGSKGLFPTKEKPGDVFTDAWRRRVEATGADAQAVATPVVALPKKRGRTIAERLRKCGSGCIVVQEPMYRRLDGEVVPGRPVLLDSLPLPWWAVKEKLRLSGDEKQLVLEVGGVDWTEGLGVVQFYKRIHYDMPLERDEVGWVRKGSFDDTA